MSLNVSTLFHLTRNSQISIEVRHNYCIIMWSCDYAFAMLHCMYTLFQSPDPVPSFYEMLLKPLDGHARDLVINITVHRNNMLISIVLENVLPSKSLWNASILAYGCQMDTHTTITELSKFCDCYGYCMLPSPLYMFI